jgi:hypothetical protein
MEFNVTFKRVVQYIFLSLQGHKIWQQTNKI